MSYNKHQILVNEILCALSKWNIRAWNHNTGMAQAFDSERIVKYGLEGSADIIGIIAPRGTFLAIEVKTGTGRQSDAQKRFESMIKKYGGIYIVARSLKDCEFLNIVV